MFPHYWRRNLRSWRCTVGLLSGLVSRISGITLRLFLAHECVGAESLTPVDCVIIHCVVFRIQEGKPDRFGVQTVKLLFPPRHLWIGVVVGGLVCTGLAEV